MTTPTPGDLSARHVEVLQGVLEAAVCPMKEHGCDGTQYPVGDPQGDYHGEQCQWCHERTEAIAALSALPAAGGGRLAAIVDAADRAVSAVSKEWPPLALPENRHHDWYTDEATGSHCVDWDDDSARQLSIMLTTNGKVTFAAYVNGQRLHGDAMGDDFMAALRAYTTPQPSVAEAHPDDLAVDRFAAAMKAKLAKKRAEGRGGWDDPAQCPVELLSNLLHEHVAKGDPVDVGNLAMMLHQRGSGVLPPPDADVGAQGEVDVLFPQLAADLRERYTLTRQPVANDGLDFEPDEQHSVADMANVGYSLMQAIARHRPGYAWNESPAEIVGDLLNEVDEATARQPVAGDGMVLTNELIDRCAQRLASWDDGCVWPYSWDARQVRTMRKDAELVLREAGFAELAAPAATPTDGGEG